jgi:hypothetical protein
MYGSAFTFTDFASHREATGLCCTSLLAKTGLKRTGNGLKQESDIRQAG